MASLLNQGVTTQSASPSPTRAFPSIAMSSILARTSSMSVAASASFTPLPPATSFFFLFSSFFFSFFLFFSPFFFFFLPFLSCSEESVDSSLEESSAGLVAR